MSRDVVRQILDVQSRQHPIGRHAAYFAIIDLARRLREQEKVEGVIEYFPIAAVRCIEVFFGNSIADLVNSGPPYDENAAGLSKFIKLDYSLVRAIHGRKITIGELVGHATSLNNVSGINAAMSSIIGRDFLVELCAVHDRWQVEVHGDPIMPIVTDKKTVLAAVDRCFECRHILCHELPDGFSLSWTEVGEFIEAVTTFLRASEQVIQNVIAPGSPLTQLAMTDAAAERAGAANAKLDDLFERLRARMGKGRFRELAAVQRKWSTFAEAHARFAANEYRGGSISPQIFYEEATALAEERIKWVEEYMKMSENV